MPFWADKKTGPQRVLEGWDSEDYTFTPVPLCREEWKKMSAKILDEGLDENFWDEVSLPEGAEQVVRDSMKAKVRKSTASRSAL